MLKAEFFKPVNDELTITEHLAIQDTVAAVTTVHSLKSGFPDTETAKIALIGAPEYRGSVNGSTNAGSNDLVRDKLYKLKRHEQTTKIIDLGDLVPGNTTEDTYFALREIVEDLMDQSIIPVIIGGSQDLTYPQYKSYESQNKLINIAGIDSRFDLGLPDDNLNSSSWLGKIVLQDPNFLFNFSNIGYQTYFVGSYAVDLMSKLFFDTYRVGEVRSDISEIEPVIRTADAVTFDLSAIKQSDAPGNTNPSPNGLTGEEACQSMYYAGMNDQLTSLGIYEYYPKNDINEQTAHLIAQMVWYFIEGLNNRKNDFPSENHKGFLSYRVTIDKAESDLVFLKHKASGRWWLEIPKIITTNKKTLKKIPIHALFLS